MKKGRQDRIAETLTRKGSVSPEFLPCFHPLLPYSSAFRELGETGEPQLSYIVAFMKCLAYVNYVERHQKISCRN